MVEDVKRLASFIPKNDRVVIFKQLYEACGSNVQDTARVLGINTRQVYFYLPKNGRRLRNYPNDDTTALIIRAVLKKDPTIIQHKMIQLSKEFNNILENLHLNGEGLN